MTQHSYDIADQPGLSFLADVNAALAAIVTNNSGATEPTEIFAHQWWADTTANMLKRRNATNTAWVSVMSLSLAITPYAETVLGGANASDMRYLIGVAPMAARVNVASVAGTVNLTTAAPLTDDIALTGALAITGFTGAAGRVIRVTATGAFTLTNNAAIVTQTGTNIIAGAGDTFMLRFTAANVAEVLSYVSASGSGSKWSNVPVGSYIGIRDDIAGVDIPPTTDPAFRYIKCTASDSYNSGVLTSESVTGTAPLVIATAVVSLTGSPFNGLTEHLINTERRSLRAGASGTLEADQLQLHHHQVSSYSTMGSGNHYHSSDTTSGSLISTAKGGGTEGFGSAVLTLAHTEQSSNASMYPAERFGIDTRVKNIGINYYLRIK